MTCVMFYTESVSYFKVEKSENLDNAFYVFYVFLKWHFKKRKKSCFFGFWKKT